MLFLADLGSVIKLVTSTFAKDDIPLLMFC